MICSDRVKVFKCAGFFLLKKLIKIIFIAVVSCRWTKLCDVFIRIINDIFSSNRKLGVAEKIFINDFYQTLFPNVRDQVLCILKQLLDRIIRQLPCKKRTKRYKSVESFHVVDIRVLNNNSTSHVNCA